MVKITTLFYKLPFFIDGKNCLDNSDVWPENFIADSQLAGGAFASVHIVRCNLFKILYSFKKKKIQKISPLKLDTMAPIVLIFFLNTVNPEAGR